MNFNILISYYLNFLMVKDSRSVFWFYILALFIESVSTLQLNSSYFSFLKLRGVFKWVIFALSIINFSHYLILSKKLPEMIDESLIKLWFTQQLSLYFDLNLMMLKIFCKKLIVIPEERVNLIYRYLFSRWDKNITGLTLRISSWIHNRLILF